MTRWEEARQRSGLFLYLGTVDSYEERVEAIRANPSATKEEITKLQIDIMNATNVHLITPEIMFRLLKLLRDGH